MQWYWIFRGNYSFKFKKIWSSEERGELKIWISESSATSLWIKHGKLAVDL